MSWPRAGSSSSLPLLLVFSICVSQHVFSVMGPDTSPGAALCTWRGGNVGMLKRENTFCTECIRARRCLRNVVNIVWKQAAPFACPGTHLCFSTDVLHHTGRHISVSCTSLTWYVKEIDWKDFRRQDNEMRRVYAWCGRSQLWSHLISNKQCVVWLLRHSPG